MKYRNKDIFHINLNVIVNSKRTERHSLPHLRPDRLPHDPHYLQSGQKQTGPRRLRGRRIELQGLIGEG